MGSMRRHIVVVGFNVAETAIQGRMSQVPKFSDLWSLWFFIPGLESMLFDRIAAISWAIIAPNLEEEKRNEEIAQNHYHLRLFLSPHPPCVSPAPLAAAFGWPPGTTRPPSDGAAACGSAAGTRPSPRV